MDQLRESSLLFSLEGLLETERERVQREAREAQKRHDEELKRVADAAERRRLAAQQEREAKERRQLLEQERERLERERLEAMKRATVERARIEAEGQMRLIELEQSRKHDLALAQIREAERTGRYRTWSWLSSAALLLVCIASGTSYFGLLKPAHAREAAQLQALLEVSQKRVTIQDRALTAERNKTRELSERLRELEARPVASEPAPPSARPATSGSSGTRDRRIIVEPPRVRCEDNGDPLNGCLTGRRR